MNRETSACRWFLPVGLDQLPSQMIQRTSDILQAVSSDKSDLRGNVFDAAYVIDQLSRLRILLGRDYIRLGIEKGVDFDLQIIDVLFGPFDFKPNIVYATGHDEDQNSGSIPSSCVS
jgi:hypothetical protein